MNAEIKTMVQCALALSQAALEAVRKYQNELEKEPEKENLLDQVDSLIDHLEYAANSLHDASSAASSL